MWFWRFFASFWKKKPSILFFLDIDIVPNSICYQEHDNLFLSCVFGDNNTIGAKFQFKPRDQPDDIYRINSTTVNFNTIEAQIPNITKSKDTGTYFCSKNGYNSRRIIYIEGSVSIFKHSIWHCRKNKPECKTIIRKANICPQIISCLDSPE